MAHSHDHNPASVPPPRRSTDLLLRSGLSRLMAAGLVSVLLWVVLLWVTKAD